MMINNNFTLNDLIRDFNLWLKIKSIFILIFLREKNLLNRLWKWNLNKKIVYKYWRKTSLFNEDTLLYSKYLKNYLDIIKDSVKSKCKMINLVWEIVVPNDCLPIL